VAGRERVASLASCSSTPCRCETFTRASLADRRRSREEVQGQIPDHLNTHENLLEARTMARESAARGDDGTDHLLVGEVMRANEVQVWFWRSTPSTCP
jgi:hypothetical protein